METVRCCCSISTHTNYHASTRTIVSIQTAGVISTHTTRLIARTWGQSTQCLSRVSIVLHWPSPSVYHTRSKIVTTGILRQLPGKLLVVFGCRRPVPVSSRHSLHVGVDESATRKLRAVIEQLP